MIQVSEPWLAIMAGMVLLAAVARGRAWAPARSLWGAAVLAWADPAALGMLAGATGIVHLAAPRRPGEHLRARVAGLALLTLIFCAARIRERLWGIGVPLGFGFAVLRIAHYWVERSRGTLPPHGLLDLFGWLTYTPTVLVGPVQRFDDWLRWERRHAWDAELARQGLWRVLVGYVKLVPVGFWLVGQRLPLWLAPLPPSVAATLVSMLLLYASFAGCSDIAVGLGRIWGQRLPENFEWPFLRTDLPSFWRSWHITVGEWVRSYVYLPLLASTRRPLLAAAAGVTIFSTWHDLSLPSVLWGFWQGLGLFAWHRVARALGDRWRLPSVRALSLLLTWTWIFLGFWFLHLWPRGEAWYER